MPVLSFMTPCLLYAAVKATSSSCLPVLHPHLVTLLYTGSISDISRYQAGQVVNLARVLDINITTEVNDDALHPSTISDENSENIKNELKLKSTMKNKFGSLSLTLPISRSNKEKLSSVDAHENMTGFQARLQR